MKITRTSPYSGKRRTLDLNVTKEQYLAWDNGMVIQEAMPGLTADEREFIISGIAPDEWNMLFSPAAEEAEKSKVALQQKSADNI